MTRLPRVCGGRVRHSSHALGFSLRAFISPALSGVDSLVLRDIPAPGPLAPGQIRVAMRAASINYRDLLVLSGALRSVTVSELIPCSDGAGEVVEVAAEVW